jgi:hypothetical protein
LSRNTFPPIPSRISTRNSSVACDELDSLDDDADDSEPDPDDGDELDELDGDEEDDEEVEEADELDDVDWLDADDELPDADDDDDDDELCSTSDRRPMRKWQKYTVSFCNVTDRYSSVNSLPSPTMQRVRPR